MGNITMIALIVCHVMYSLIPHSSAYESYMELLPNGDQVPHPCGGGRIWQGLGHHYPEGSKGPGGVRNQFGYDLVDAGLEWTRELCLKDSDKDGKTNGEEMGDPDCTWKRGAKPKVPASSHPGICEPVESPTCKGRNTRFGDRINCTALINSPCSSLSEKGVIRKDIRFPISRIPNVVTSYTCMLYDLPADDDYHLVATTPLINNTAIVHHIILFGCDFPGNFNQTTLHMMKASPYSCGMTPHQHCQSFLSTWTYGFKEDCVSRDAGFRIGQHGTRMAALQIHWNNPQKLAGQTDNSGLTLHYTLTRRPYDASIFIVGQEYLNIPAGSSDVKHYAVCPGKCTREMFKEKIYITRAANHMHYFGRRQRITLFRNGTKVRDLTNDDNYNYDAPVFIHFNPPVEVLPGDDIITECMYASDPDRTVVYGAGTDNEMCYGFLTYYPVQDFLQTLCISWKSVQRCVRKLPKFKGIYGNCDLQGFTRGASGESLRKAALNDSCGGYPYNKHCSDKCVEHSTELLRHPCLQGDLGDFMEMRAQIPLPILRTCAASSSASRRWFYSRTLTVFVVFNLLIYLCI